MLLLYRNDNFLLSKHRNSKKNYKFILEILSTFFSENEFFSSKYFNFSSCKIYIVTFFSFLKYYDLILKI